jgi:hypothetical protein
MSMTMTMTITMSNDTLNNINDTFIFSHLPINLLHYIFEFSNVIYYHKGKYICKLNKNDHRYNMLMHIPQPVKLDVDSYNLYLVNKKTSLGYILHYNIDIPNNVITLKLIFNRAGDGYFFDNSRTTEWYIIPKTYSKWRRIISYEEFDN